MIYSKMKFVIPMVAMAACTPVTDPNTPETDPLDPAGAITTSEVEDVLTALFDAAVGLDAFEGGTVDTVNMPTAGIASFTGGILFVDDPSQASAIETESDIFDTDFTGIIGTIALDADFDAKTISGSSGSFREATVNIGSDYADSFDLENLSADDISVSEIMTDVLSLGDAVTGSLDLTDGVIDGSTFVATLAGTVDGNSHDLDVEGGFVSLDGGQANALLGLGVNSDYSGEGDPDTLAIFVADED